MQDLVGAAQEHRLVIGQTSIKSAVCVTMMSVPVCAEASVPDPDPKSIHCLHVEESPDAGKMSELIGATVEKL